MFIIYEKSEKTPKAPYPSEKIKLDEIDTFAWYTIIAEVILHATLIS